jgi:hypothetical protein
MLSDMLRVEPTSRRGNGAAPQFEAEGCGLQIEKLRNNQELSQGAGQIMVTWADEANPGVRDFCRSSVFRLLV